MSRVRVDRVELRLEGASRARAAEIASELRESLPAALHRELLGDRSGLHGSHDVGELRLRVRAGSTGSATARAVSREVATSVREAVDGGNGDSPTTRTR